MSGDTSGNSAASEEIMEATYEALCKHGYAALTMQNIADESTKSKAALHYHYDTKDELLISFLDYLYESFTDEYAETDGDDAVDRLVGFVDDVLCHENVDDVEQFQTALLEIKAQAPYVDDYREQLERVDAFVRERVENIVADGIEEGVFREDIDPADTAAFIATLMTGVNTRRVSTGETDGSVRSVFVEYVRESMVSADSDVEVPA
jgi:AcrR family transcriptional regulator